MVEFESTGKRENCSDLKAAIPDSSLAFLPSDRIVSSSSLHIA
jgi:hypothetical protein